MNRGSAAKGQGRGGGPDVKQCVWTGRGPRGWFVVWLVCAACAWGDAVVIDHRHTDITRLTEAQINRAKAVLHIAYGHTSHGSQLTSGMSGLVGFANGGGKGLSLPENIFAWNNGGSDGALDLHDGAMDGDVGYYPAWVNNTTAYLDNPANSNVNVIIWSWCGQMTGKYTGGTLTNEYLAPMSMLETSYPDVVFVYMTGHADYDHDADQKAACEAIRNYCAERGKVLYDFADIEHYNPDGTYFEYVRDDCRYYNASGTYLGNWAVEWQDAHTQNVDWYDSYAAHSEPLNGNLKAYAAWALWCALADDMDRDGLSDTWEEQYGGQGLFSGGSSDYDGDGQPDRDEWVAGTVPTNAESRFVISNIRAQENNSISFLSVTSRFYSLFCCSALTDADWSGVSGATNQPGTGQEMTLSDTNAAQVMNRFYRLGVALP